MINLLNDDVKARLRMPYAARLVPSTDVASLLPLPLAPQVGEIALARVEKIGKNAALELADGRRCTLHERDLVIVVFGNRYATMQFEGYVGTVGNNCDLLSMGGLCGLVRSKHARSPEPTKLSLLGAVGDRHGSRLNIKTYAHRARGVRPLPNVVAVCGTSMDAGKTHTAASLIKGLSVQGLPVAGIKLTGTAAGKDTCNMLDAGAITALDFVDGGLPSTYMTKLDELLSLNNLLLSLAAEKGAEWAVVEIADGLLQGETSALLQSADYLDTVDAWVFASAGSLGTVGGLGLLRGWGIEPLAVSGLGSLSPLGMRETEAATGVTCVTASQIQSGVLNAKLRSIAEARLTSVGASERVSVVA